MRSRGIAEAEACFDFMVQFQIDSVRMPIEDATAEWDEQDAPYAPVAKIRIPQQRVDDPERADACERFAFNPWHCPTEHRPLGNLNRARREIYLRAQPVSRTNVVSIGRAVNESSARSFDAFSVITAAMPTGSSR